MIRGLRILRIGVLALLIIVVILKFTTNFNSSTVKEYTQGFANNAGAGYHADAKGNAAISNPSENAPKAQEAGAVVSTPKAPERENATFVTLARNEDLWALVGSIREVEDRFNHQYHYDWVFLNDKEFLWMVRVVSPHVSLRIRLFLA